MEIRLAVQCRRDGPEERGGSDDQSSRAAPEDFMTATDLVNNFSRLESRISEKKGDFTLFALFLREDVADRWDLMVSAPWVGTDRKGALQYFVDEIRSFLGPEDLTVLARIVIVDPNDAAVQNLNRAISVEHGRTEVRDSNFFGLPIKHAYIITSKLPSAPVAG